MTFQPNPNRIEWKLHLRSAPSRVFEALSTDRGRATFWAESTIEQDGQIAWTFPGGHTWTWPLLASEPPYRYVVGYYGGSRVTFTLADDGHGGTDLALCAEGTPLEDRVEVIAGWVSVLLALKTAVDFGVDLRTHDETRTWWHGYAEN